MPLLQLNETQEAQILEVLYASTAKSIVPLLLLEGFMLGASSACVPLASYMLWMNVTSIRRGCSILVVWATLTVFAVHWALSLQNLESVISGSALNISLPILDHDVISPSGINISDAALFRRDIVFDTEISYSDYSAAWEHLVTLTTETVLLGFASSLFATTVYTSFTQFLTQDRGSSVFIVPAIASSYARPSSGDLVLLDARLDIIMATTLAVNAILSDSIVLWRMIVVWEKRYPILAVCVVLLVTMLGTNIAFIVISVPPVSGRLSKYLRFGLRPGTVEGLIPAYDDDVFGLAAIFVSLASNASATALVGLKAWLYRRQIKEYIGSHCRRTIVERVLLLLTDSGVVYTVIWLVYCISVYFPITVQFLIPGNPIYAVDYLDAAMAQITTIYPLSVFIFLAYDQMQHSREPQLGSLRFASRSQNPARSFVSEMDLERRTEPTVLVGRQPSRRSREEPNDGEEGEVLAQGVEETKLHTINPV
ncbi:unnamed protein product [Peniophora sp. CBMAI 1063]|nr:unnamed protein product [Peniophora sp. CBMAI 1063]